MRVIEEQSSRADEIRRAYIEKRRKRSGFIVGGIGAYNLVVVIISVTFLFTAAVVVFNDDDEDDTSLTSRLNRLYRTIFIITGLALIPFGIVYSLMMISSYLILKKRREKFCMVILITGTIFLLISLAFNLLITLGLLIEEDYVLSSIMIAPIIMKVLSVCLAVVSIMDLREIKPDHYLSRSTTS